MSVDVVELEEDQAEEWDAYVDRSPDTNVFHREAALRLQASHAGAELHRLVGYKGQEPVGIFPIFERKRGPLTAALSPPPSLGVPRLGPARLNAEQLKQRKAEKRRHRFLDGCSGWLEDNVGADYVNVVTTGSFRDVRPFKWDGADVTPEYTYVVDLTPDPDDLLASFSSDARGNIRKSDDARYTIDVGTDEDLGRILDQIRERYDEQGKTFRVPAGFVEDLFAELPDGQVRPYVCEVDGEFAGGVVTIEDDRRIYSWLGGAKPGHETDLPVNDLLDWHIMVESKDRPPEQYDLCGASERKLIEYKAKFSPTLETIYLVEGGRWPVKRLVDLYAKVR